MKKLFHCSLLAIVVGASTINSYAIDNITFDNIAKNKKTGITFERTKSKTHEKIEEFRQRSLTDPHAFAELFETPTETHGLPGIAILDYDRDGDLDVYLTNGPDSANSLYSNQFEETGKLTFIDVAEQANVAAYDQDSTGVCFGDIDNDNDLDLLVLGRKEVNRLFVNDGNGKFSSSSSNGLDDVELTSSSCSMGDVNNDGLLDIIVGNIWNIERYSPCFVENFEFNDPNQLYLNKGNNTFNNVSKTSGILDLKGFPDTEKGAAGITWGSAMIDINLDGNTDIVFADEQCATPIEREGGVNRGFIHVLVNDGNANFVDEPIIVNDVSSAGWMGLGFGDINCDSNFDVVASNGGDYIMPALGVPYVLGKMSTNWFLGGDDGKFTDPGVGELISSVFSWGVGVLDYDNDGDQDMMFQGGLDINYQVWADNPGVILQNQNCGSNFTWDKQALSTDYTRLNARALAFGDLNKDGFMDFVTSSNFVIPEDLELKVSPGNYGSVFDETAFYLPIFESQSSTPGDEQYIWNGNDLAPGYPTIEINSANNGNGSVTVSLVGSVNLTKKGTVNRDGMGAVIKFTPESYYGKPGKSVMSTIPNGSSFASQHSLEMIFGLGQEYSGTVDVLWPGGVKNRLYHVASGERIKFPEIPCSYDGEWKSNKKYVRCVRKSLRDLVKAGVINKSEKRRYYESALYAHYEELSKRKRIAKK